VSQQRPIKILLSIQNERTRSRCSRFLQELQADGRLAARMPRYGVEVKECNSPEDALQELRLQFQASKTSSALLISDLLAELSGSFPNEEARPTAWTKENILDSFEGCLLGTVALMDRPRRVPDIDRVLCENFDAEALLNVLGLVADKLAYLARPEPMAPAPGSVVVRPINDKTELQDYFHLRHRIYRIMGYLEPRVELAPSLMEIDPCDTRAFPVGAFIKVGATQKLVGTARVVSFEVLDDRYDRWTRSLMKTDPVLNTRLDLYDPMGLPIFQSMKLNEQMGQVLTLAQNCGELSRVIVAEDFRGLGISELLVWFTFRSTSGFTASSASNACKVSRER
jgi:hypothetical protein